LLYCWIILGEGQGGETVNSFDGFDNEIYIVSGGEEVKNDKFGIGFNLVIELGVLPRKSDDVVPANRSHGIPDC
jgi:hypothetical protein